MVRRPGIPLLLLLLPALAAASTAPPAPAGAGTTPPPVFYQCYPEPGEPGDLELLREGRVRVQHYAPVDVSHFAWERSSFNDYTWWMQMQDLRFILPAIESPNDDDLRLANAWFMRWYARHMVPGPDVSRWGEPMTVAYRAMVLVRLLDAGEERDQTDEAVRGFIRETIVAHQRDLIRPQRFSETSNHGFIAALGLFETTRVEPDSAAVAVALTRLETMAAAAVSPAGVEKEHSTAYHFVVMEWLERISRYLDSLPGPARETGARLGAVAGRMRTAAWFLTDHDGRMPPIGDTDSLVVEPAAPATGPMLYDPDAGWAVYKGEPARNDCRYVVFRVPGGRAGMQSHAHDDALAVFFNHAGETILGDAGRYSYSSSPERAFVRARCAHNSVVSYPVFVEAGPVLRPARDVHALDGRTGWSASTVLGATAWTRSVSVPASGRTLIIEDELDAAPPGAARSADLAVLWHLGSDVTTVEPAKTSTKDVRAWTLSTRAGQRIRLAIEAKGPGDSGLVDGELVRGRRDGLLGWYSPGQKRMHPVTTIVTRMRREPRVTVVTRIDVETAGCRAGR